MVNERAEQEFAFVAAQLTTDELDKLDQRVVNGEIEGRWYLSGEYSSLYGCFFGTIAILRNLVKTDYEDSEVVRLKCELTQHDLAHSTFYFTAIEEVLLNTELEYGMTPEMNAGSAWLHGLLSAEIARRQS